MRWWHKLGYWKKGALIGLVIGAILIFLILKIEDSYQDLKPLTNKILIYYTIVEAVGGLGHIAWIFGKGSIITQIFIFLYGGLPTAIIGGLIGLLMQKRS